MMTELGSAMSCSRAAIFGASPTTATDSTVLPACSSPAITRPVWIPIRTAIASLAGSSALVPSRVVSSISWSAAWTARAASFSWARG